MFNPDNSFGKPLKRPDSGFEKVRLNSGNPEGLILPATEQEFSQMLRNLGRSAGANPENTLISLIKLFTRLTNSDDRLLTPQAIGNIAQLLASIHNESKRSGQPYNRSYEQHMLMSLGQKFLTASNHFDSESLRKIAYAFASMKFRDKKVFNQISMECQERITDFTADDLCNISWSFAVLAIKDIPLCEAIASKISSGEKIFKEKDPAQLAWTFAVCAPHLVGRVIDSSKLSSTRDTNLWMQAYHALLAAELIEPSVNYLKIDEWKDKHKKRSSNEKMILEVYEQLEYMYGSRNCNIHIQDYIAAVPADIILTASGANTDRKFVIKCFIHPAHYSSGPDGGELLGNEQLQDTILKIFGYKAIHLRVNDWRAASNKAELLQELLV